MVALVCLLAYDLSALLFAIQNAEARSLADATPGAALPLLTEAIATAQRSQQRREEISATSLMGKALRRCQGCRKHVKTSREFFFPQHLLHISGFERIQQIHDS